MAGQGFAQELQKAIAIALGVWALRKVFPRKNKMILIRPTTYPEKDGSVLGLNPKGNKNGN
jgi:hypothetical protein